MAVKQTIFVYSNQPGLCNFLLVNCERKNKQKQSSLALFVLQMLSFPCHHYYTERCNLPQINCIRVCG